MITVVLATRRLLSCGALSLAVVGLCDSLMRRAARKHRCNRSSGLEMQGFVELFGRRALRGSDTPGDALSAKIPYVGHPAGCRR